MKITEILSEAKAVKQRLDPKCWKGKHKEGTKIKGGVRVNNCVPNESVSEVFDGDKETGTTHKGGVVTKTTHGIKHTKTNYDDGNGEKGAKRKEGGRKNRYHHTPILDKDIDEAANAAQQAAIAIAKKKKKSVAEGHADQQRRIFKKNGHPVGEVGIDRESSPGNGQWYMKYYPTGDDFGGYDTMEEAVADLKHLVNQFKAEGVAEGSDELFRILDLSGLTLTADEQFDIIEEMVEAFAQHHGVDSEQIWEDFESVDDHELLDESAAWHRKAGKSKSGGLNKKGVASYRREHPGSKLQTAVTTKPSKLKKGSKASKRRKSFCARMGGMKGAMKKPNGKPTRKALALRKWHC